MPNLPEIEKQIDETLAGETTKSLNNWLNKVNWITNNQKKIMDYLIEASEVKKNITQEEMNKELNKLIKRAFDYCENNSLVIVESLVYIEDMCDVNILQFRFKVTEKPRVLAYTEKDLVSFGRYMVSKERKNRYKNHPAYPNNERLKERLREVNHADLCNWKEKEGI